MSEASNPEPRKPIMIDPNDPRLTAYVLGELTSSEMTEVENAIQASPELAVAAEQIRAMTGSLSDAYRDEAQPSLSEAQKSVLTKSAVAAEPAKSRSDESRRWLAAAVAACLATVIFGGWFLMDDWTTISMGEPSMSQPEGWTSHTPPDSAFEPEPPRGAAEPSIVLPNADKWVEERRSRSRYQGVELTDREDIETVEDQEYDEIPSMANPPMSPESAANELFGKQEDRSLPGPSSNETIATHDRHPTDLEGQRRPREANDIVNSVDGRRVRGFGSEPTPNRSSRQRQQNGGLLGGGGRLSEGGKFYDDASEEMLTEDSISGKHRPLVTGGASASAPRWSPDGSHFEVAGQRDPSEPSLIGETGDAELEPQRIGIQTADFTRELPVEEIKGKLKEIEREKVATAQLLANLFSQNREVTEQLEERGESLKAEIQSNRDRLRRLENAEKRLQKQDEQLKKSKPKSWKRVKAIPNTTRLMVGDKEELGLSGMQVNAQVDGFRARVLVDYFFYNDRETQLEGNFKLRLPDDASLYYFAFGESAYDFSPEGKLANQEFLRDGTQFVSLSAPAVKETRKGQWDNVKEARMVPKEKAAHAFRETVRRRVDPALVEWSGAGVFSAKVFPLAPKKLHRIVVGYDVNLKRGKDDMTFTLTLPEQTGQCRVEVNVPEIEGVTYSATPEVDPIARDRNGQLQKRFVFDNDDAKLSSVELKIAGAGGLALMTPMEKVISIKKTKPNNGTLPLGGSDGAARKGGDRPGRVERDADSEEQDQGEKELNPPRSKPSGDDPSRPSQREGDDGDGFWTMQITPDLPSESADGNSRAIFLVDTSLSADPAKFTIWVHLLQAMLNNNRDSLKEFDVLFFNVDGHFWKGEYVANTEANVNELKTTLNNLALEGATDLYAAIESVTQADWIADEKNRPDLFLLSDGAATWGETDLRIINELLQQPQCGSLFAYQTGLAGTAISNLRFLAGQSGGAVFSVTNRNELKTASTAHRQRPWKLESIVAAGATDILTAGRIEWLYPGQTVTVVGRGKIEDKVELTFGQGGQSTTVTAQPTSIESELASRMYGHVAVGQLESLGAKVINVATAYARHFRITGQTCSLLMLESEADYQRFGIKPQEDLFVVKAKAASKLVDETLAKHAEALANPKVRLRDWLGRLESMPGMEFEMPTALELAFDDIEIEAVSEPLNCELTQKEPLSKSYLKSIQREQLDYETIAAEALKRKKLSVDDSLKVFSSLIERNPGDITIARDVAFTAMELKRPGAAFHLLRRVAEARPFQGNIYPAIGQCLMQLGKADMAIVYYEIAINGSFQRQGGDFKQIVAAEYSFLLRQIVSGKLDSSVKDFAKARLETLSKHLPFGTADVVVTMMWNQDQTDVDLHVTEPSGEECCYSHKDTRSGGHITSDIRTGFGPEMYFLADAPEGKYQVKAKFYSNGQNRTSTRNKVYVTVFEGFGTDAESMTRQTIQLPTVGEVVPVMTLGVE